VWDFMRDLFDHSDFVPRQFCGSWSTELIRLHNISDASIWLAYMAIPVVLLWFARRRRDLPFRWVFWLFASFIIGCGFTHFMGVVVFYVPLYRLDGLL
jgi:hypothetical protein